MLHPAEIRPGLVLRLDPYRLLDFGADTITDGRGRVWTPHWFICLDRVGDGSTWVATSSKMGAGRAPVSRKWGQPEWTLRTTYVDYYGIWTVPSFLGIRAAAIGVDPSHPGCRNFASLDFAADGAVAA